MGVFNPGLLIEFACTEVTAPTVLTAAAATANIANVTIDVDSTDNTIWFTAYTQWVGSAGNEQLTMQIVRGEDVICSTTDTSTQAGGGGAATPRPVTTAITCCDNNPPEGDTTYTLRVIAENLDGRQTITIQDGTFTAAEIRGV